MLDFNSLYPSIIQEYNLCFTTVERPAIPLKNYLYAPAKAKGKTAKKRVIETEEQKKGGNVQQDEDEALQERLQQIPDLPQIRDEKQWGILPRVIKHLVDCRKEVKNQLKYEKNKSNREALDIKQKAFKLVANSMYGCLGFKQSRFYAQGIAALITKQGRSILENSVSVVEGENFEVIYGDTDSLMIYPKKPTILEIVAVGERIKLLVNKKYRKLVIDIDGLFKNMLLLKKKKYAALKLENLPDFFTCENKEAFQPKWYTEMKGLDLVRRDWSDISRNTGKEVLNIILKGGEESELLKNIHDRLTRLSNSPPLLAQA